jgi:hypothetical protein
MAENISNSGLPTTPAGWVVLTDIYGNNYYLNISTDVISETHPSKENTLNKKASIILPTLNILNVTGGASDILNYLNMKKKIDDDKKNETSKISNITTNESEKTNTSLETKPSNTKTKQKKRCDFCNKKSLILFNCKCGIHTCMKHKFPETHSCTYDFKSENVLGEKCDFSKLNKIT